MRSVEHIERIARTAHPSGTADAAAVRSYVAGQLAALGLNPVQRESTEVLARQTSAHLAGRVHNVTATIPGRSPTGRVLLVAHTDSVPFGPGASDDGLGLASLLEIARALKAGAPPRNDVVFLFTDAEEVGQLGARAFVRDIDDAAGERDVVINLDARGTSGRAIMFETGAHDSAVIGALRNAPPVATSVADEVYRLLPHQTDFTVLRAAGLTGLNFAVIGGSARYHTPEDDVDHVDPRSLHDMGHTALSATRALSAMDLTSVAEAPEATWFTVGPVLVRYPTGAVLPLAAAAVVAVAAAVWYAARRERLRARPAVLTALTFPVVSVVAAGVGWAGWQALVLLNPAYASFPLGDPYRTGTAVAGLLLLAATGTWFWAVGVGVRATAVEAVVGVTLWLALLAALTAVLLPGAAYVFTWCSFGGAIGVAVAARLPRDSRWRAVALAVPALPGALLIAPLVALLFPALGLAVAAAPLALAALVAAVVMLPGADMIEAAGRRRAVAAGLSAALVGVGLVGAHAVLDTTDPEHPRPVSLMYAMDAGRSLAHWVSEDADPGPWVSHYTGSRRTDALEEWSPALVAPPGGHVAAEAPLAAVSRPSVRVLADTRSGDDRTLRLSVAPEAGTPILLNLYVDTSSAEVVGAYVAGTPSGAEALTGGVNRPFTGSVWKWGLVFVAPPAAGYELTLTTRGDGPLRLLVMTEDVGLPASALDRPRPAHLTWLSDAAGVSFTSRTVTF